MADNNDKKEGTRPQKKGATLGELLAAKGQSLQAMKEKLPEQPKPKKEKPRKDPGGQPPSGEGTLLGAAAAEHSKGKQKEPRKAAAPNPTKNRFKKPSTDPEDQL